MTFLCWLNSNCREPNDDGHILNIKNQRGINLLAIACIHGHVNLATRLLDLQCNVMIKCNGELPIELAVRWKHFALFELMVQRRVYEVAVVNEVVRGVGDGMWREVVRKWYPEWRDRRSRMSVGFMCF